MPRIVWAMLLGSLAAAFVATGAGAKPAAQDQDAVPPGRWELQALVNADGSGIVPANPANYTVRFVPGERSVVYPEGHEDPFGDPDGRIDLQLDCNGGSADYRIDGNRLTITNLVASLQGCHPPSLGETFADRLLAVTAYTLEGEELALWTADCGHLRFAPTPAAPTEEEAAGRRAFFQTGQGVA